eukprot:9519034-Karenia_brevis.AAC.1
MRSDGSFVEDVIDAPGDELPLGETEPATGPSSSTSSSSSSEVVNEDANFSGAVNARAVVVNNNETVGSPSRAGDRLSGFSLLVLDDVIAKNKNSFNRYQLSKYVYVSHLWSGASQPADAHKAASTPLNKHADFLKMQVPKPKTNCSDVGRKATDG